MRSKKLTRVFVVILAMILCCGNIFTAYGEEFSSGGTVQAEIAAQGFDTEDIFSDSGQAAASAEIAPAETTSAGTESTETAEAESAEIESVEADGAVAEESVESELFTDDAAAISDEETADITDSQGVTEQEFIFVNPLYEDVVTIEDLAHLESADEEFDIQSIAENDDVSVFSSRAARTQSASVTTCDTIEEAGLQVRECMLSREAEVQIVYVTTEALDSEDVFDMMEYAVAHTGNPVEGDYLKYQYAGFKVSLKGYSNYYSLSWSIEYYTTAEQEAAMNQAVAKLLRSKSLAGKTDYEKLAAIYDYICTNVSYDYTNLNNSDYNLKYTGYAALVNGTSVCQGYAVLMYRLLLASGVDCRIVAGESYGEKHSWNIVKLGNQYYNVDATWDAGYLTYKYFLKSEANFIGHDRDAEYAAASFYAQYPMGSSDYAVQDSDISSGIQYVENEVVYHIVNGTAIVMEYQGTDTKAVIPGVVNGVSVTSVSSYAFYDCESLEMIQFTGNAPAIDRLAFYGGDAVVVYPYGNATWTENMLQNYSGSVQWVAHGENVHTWIVNSAANVAAACETEGKKVWNCQICGLEKSETLPVTGHSWGTWTVTKEASYEADGLQEHVCSSCGKKETETIAKKVLASPEITVTELAYNKVRVSWNLVDDADGYRVYRKVSGGSWTRLGTLSSTTKTYTDKTVVPGTKYYYSIRAYCKTSSTKIFSEYRYSSAITTKTAAPTLVSTTAASYNKITVKWEKVSGASGYRIYRKTVGGSWKKLADVSSSTTSYTNSVTTGVTYYYTVRSYRKVNGTKVLGRYNTTGLKGVAKTAAPKLVSAKIASKTSTKITWNKVSGASGYRVYVKGTDGKWKVLATLGSSSSSYTYKKENGKSYTYTVRSYRTVNGTKVWGGYSKTGITSK